MTLNACNQTELYANSSVLYPSLSLQYSLKQIECMTIYLYFHYKLFFYLRYITIHRGSFIPQHFGYLSVISFMENECEVQLIVLWFKSLSFSIDIKRMFLVLIFTMTICPYLHISCWFIHVRSGTAHFPNLLLSMSQAFQEYNKMGN